MGLWNRLLEKITHAIGALPARRVTWGLVLVFSAWVVLDVMVFKISGGLARSSFDAMVRARVNATAPDPRIVIIDIDEASLARMGREFGRWPWPRDTLATVLEFLERHGPKAIVWDVVFSDADHLSPGGDAAFDAAVKKSPHSHFSVVRLPPANDGLSQITRTALPGLWVPHATGLKPATQTQPATVALIPPALPGVAASRLGYNNGYVDRDGVLRRYRYIEPLADGSAIQSIVASVVFSINAKAHGENLIRAAGVFEPQDELIAWRARPNAYPRVSFADVFAQAEGGAAAKPGASQTSFADKIIIIGSTAPSLHDIHPTPLSPMQPGVDSLATALDNALNQRQLHELPRWLQAVLAIALCAGLALWVQFASVASLAPALFALPIALLGISYLSLNGLPIFLDLHLAAGLALVFLALLRVWSTLRRNHWCAPPIATNQPLAIWAWERRDSWLEAPLDRLIDAVALHAPTCRVVVCDASITWPATLRWPELARCAAVVGPRDDLLAAQAALQITRNRLADGALPLQSVDKHPNREELAQLIIETWATLQKAQKDQVRPAMPSDLQPTVATPSTTRNASTPNET
jgi:adenylate cyclase